MDKSEEITGILTGISGSLDFFPKSIDKGIDNIFSIITGYIDEHGNPIKRTKLTHPYNYDSFVVWDIRKNSTIRPTGTIYSDRMLQHDYNKYNKCRIEVFGDESQIFYKCDPKLIELLLQKYLDKPNLKLLLIMECCNQSNGYPLWRFDYGEMDIDN